MFLCLGTPQESSLKPSGTDCHSSGRTSGQERCQNQGRGPNKRKRLNGPMRSSQAPESGVQYVFVAFPAFPFIVRHIDFCFFLPIFPPCNSASFAWTIMPCFPLSRTSRLLDSVPDAGVLTAWLDSSKLPFLQTRISG